MSIYFQKHSMSGFSVYQIQGYQNLFKSKSTYYTGLKQTFYHLPYNLREGVKWV